MPEVHLKQPGFTYRACDLFTKSKEKSKDSRKQEIQILFTKMILIKLFSAFMVFGKYKDLNERTQSDKVLRDKAFEIANDPKYDGYQSWLASMLYKFFDKTSTGSSANFISNQQLANELHRPFTRQFKRRKFYSSFKDNIFGADLTDMQLIGKYNKRGIRYLLCAIDLFSKYVWVVPLKDNKRS